MNGSSLRNRVLLFLLAGTLSASGCTWPKKDKNPRPIEPPTITSAPVQRGWGETPKVLEGETGQCVLFSEAMVLLQYEGTLIDTAERATDCNPSPSAGTIEVGMPSDVRGAVGHLIFVTEETGSDYYHLTVYDASTGKEALVLEDVSPVSNTYVDVEARKLVYSDGFRPPESCPEQTEDFAAWENACWSEVQKLYPTLAAAPPPHCSCGPSGLFPYVMATYTRSLDDLSAEPVPVPPIICGCSS